jgi:hypothetical protein
VVTEYGIADLRGKNDRDVDPPCWRSRICVSGRSLRRAKDAGKIEQDFELPRSAGTTRPTASSGRFRRRASRDCCRCSPSAAILRKPSSASSPRCSCSRRASPLQLAGLAGHGLFSARRRAKYGIASSAWGWSAGQSPRITSTLRLARALDAVTLPARSEAR